jgi:hypothetical protein
MRERLGVGHVAAPECRSNALNVKCCSPKALKWVGLRATSHTRLRARDRYTTSTLIGGKGRAGSTEYRSTIAGSSKNHSKNQKRKY